MPQQCLDKRKTHGRMVPGMALSGTFILALLLTGCAQQPAARDTQAGADDGGYCLRAGDDQAFDCSSPALPLHLVRDPLAPDPRFNNEEMMTLLAEVRRWLARRKLTLQGEAIPRELREQSHPGSADPVTATDTLPTEAQLPRPWALILNDFSPQSLQRSNSAPD